MIRSATARCLIVAAFVLAGFALVGCEYHKTDKDGNRVQINKEEYDRLKAN
ncbi:MAG: hypothetical protein AAFY08_12440 [Planctomycetota bacterium]